VAEASKRSVLSVLTKGRLEDLGREFGVFLPATATKDAQVAVLADSALDLGSVLGRLRRDELRSACRAHGVDATGRGRNDLMARLGGPGMATGAREAGPAWQRSHRADGLPREGQVVQVRQRQYLVTEVASPDLCEDRSGQTLVSLVCLDDDAAGRRLEVLWERELGARVVEPEAHGLGKAERLDPPRHFAAYLHALKWGCVTATDSRLFQSPFRAGVKLLDHQLVPLRKALELPRVNLFLADDVGLGKTIEAGLILQELMLRQRVDQALIICPAALALQWRAEMEKRFGIRFEIYNRDFVCRRREERGFGVNPWTTFPRFIISYQTLRRPEYREPLLRHLDQRAPKSLLIMDEAHTAAPASASKYAVDSHVTNVVREVAPKFEHRLFLSATPHNGHSNSFSSLLEILDPQRFTRGVPVSGPKQLDPVMVRRLKGELRELGVEGYPLRRVIQIDLTHGAEGWQQRYATEDAAVVVGDGTSAEIDLSVLLAQYAALLKQKNRRSRLVIANLQKRLLSSIEAFARTLAVHAKSVGARTDQAVASASPPDDDEYGEDETTSDERSDSQMILLSCGLAAPSTDARSLLERMTSLAEQSRRAPGPKVLALLDWIRRNQCPAVQLGGATPTRSPASWTDRRLIVFTEYADTKRYLAAILRAAFDGTADGDLRLMEFHGGMSDRQREEVQRAFNGPPDQYPVRILLATDAAREGVNLQGYCADIFHFDVPWNPARLEQRNGRVDRTLQREKEVRCHYFFYPQRAEDHVLQILIEKVERIRRDLGSLGEVVAARLADVLEDGIGPDTQARLDEAERVDEQNVTVTRELGPKQAVDKARSEIDLVARILNDSRGVMSFEPGLLCEALNVGLGLAGEKPLVPTGTPHTFNLPELSDTWQNTLDAFRPPRERDEAFWDWRKRPLRPVTFVPPEHMNDEVVQLHLQHPFVQRVLSRFRAQGWAAHDLGHVTVLRNPRDAIARVIGIGRLSLFGPGATRLHEEIILIAAQWIESRTDGRLKPFAEEADRKAIADLERLLAEAPDQPDINDTVRRRLQNAAPADFGDLWKHIQVEAESREHDAREKLRTRARTESEALRKILEDQRAAIRQTLQGQQLAFDFTEADKDQRIQFEQDRKHMTARLSEIDGEIETQPREIEGLYQVMLRRLEPVGLVYLWPTTR
jgi:hypothetical protein